MSAALASQLTQPAHCGYLTGESIAERNQWLACMPPAMNERTVDPGLA